MADLRSNEQSIAPGRRSYLNFSNGSAAGKEASSPGFLTNSAPASFLVAFWTQRGAGRDDHLRDVHKFAVVAAGQLLQPAERGGFIELRLFHETSLGPLDQLA